MIHKFLLFILLFITLFVSSITYKEHFFVFLAPANIASITNTANNYKPIDTCNTSNSFNTAKITTLNNTGGAINTIKAANTVKVSNNANVSNNTNAVNNTNSSNNTNVANTNVANINNTINNTTNASNKNTLNVAIVPKIKPDINITHQDLLDTIAKLQLQISSIQSDMNGLKNISVTTTTDLKTAQDTYNNLVKLSSTQYESDIIQYKTNSNSKVANCKTQLITEHEKYNIANKNYSKFKADTFELMNRSQMCYQQITQMETQFDNLTKQYNAIPNKKATQSIS